MDLAPRVKNCSKNAGAHSHRRRSLQGRIKVWDVVNEAISDGGPDILRTSPWSVIIGPDFIEKAFQYAHEADPDAILRYNDYGLENPESRKLITLIKQLHDEGARHGHRITGSSQCFHYV